ncbi:MAG: gliding motility-associated C-terminal domain-containing protein [Vicingus serpentipes]|nr:gliding motility-associated C-terminal domain-containing protein [Vicingus serpentipes]
MKKRLLLSVIFLPLLINTGLRAQCNLGVGIDRNPTGFVCKDVPIKYTAQPTGNPPNPQYVWVVNGDTVGMDSTVTLSDMNIVDLRLYMTDSSCSVPDTFFTNNIYHQAVTYEITTETIIEECNQKVADLRIIEVIGIGGEPPYSYDLLNGEGTEGQKELYPELPVGNYQVYVEDNQGCGDTVWVVMDQNPCDPPYPSEVITPNGDGHNDTWIIANIQDYPNNEVFVFDRWGQRVYHKKNYDNVEAWDVTYLAVDLPVSTYYYVLKVVLEKGDDFVLKGAISVFR